MTQKSYPWPGIAPTNGDDAGRYTAPEWWALWASANRAGGLIVPAAAAPLRTLSALANIGVYYCIPNQLEVTDAGGLVAEVDTGGALVDGQFHYNDDTVTLTLPASQNYYIVLRKNFTAVDYTPPGYAAGDGVVPAYTTRITWVSAIVQSTDRSTYWDMPLAEFTTDASDITDLTDTREFVDAEVKKVSFQFTGGWNATLASELEHSSFSHGFRLLDTDTTYASALFQLPHDYISDGVLTAVVVKPTGQAAGNYYISLSMYYGACSEDWDTHFTTSGATVVAALGDDVLHCLSDIEVNVPASATINDIVSMSLNRQGGNGSDTAGNCNAYYIILEYLGWK